MSARIGYAIVSVEKIERDTCDFCEFDGKRRIATHRVKVGHHIRWLGVVSGLSACEKHALEIAREFERQTKGGAS